MVKTDTYGLNILRVYELSFLNNKGKPQVAVLEMQRSCTEPEFDTQELKEYFTSINNTVISDLNIIKKKLDSTTVIITPELEFADIEFFELSAKLNNKYHLISEPLRFICQKTLQPYIGTLNLCLAKNTLLNIILLRDLLTSIRNSKYLAADCANYLFERLALEFGPDFVFSLHLNRRGGISQQLIRAQKPQDFAIFSYRSVLE